MPSYLNSSLVFNTLDDVLKVLSKVPITDLDEFYRLHSTNINKKIKDFDDIILCAERLAPEVFKLIIQHIYFFLFDLDKMEIFLGFNNVPIQTKMITLLKSFQYKKYNFYELITYIEGLSLVKEERKALINLTINYFIETDNIAYRYKDFFIKDVRLINDLSISLAEKQRIILIFIQRNKELMNNYFEEEIKFFYELCLSKEDKLKLISESLNRKIAKSTKNYDFFNAISLLKNILPLKEDELFIANLIEQTISKNTKFFNDYSKFCDLVEYLDLDVFSFENSFLKYSLLETLIEKTTKYCGWFLNPETYPDRDGNPYYRCFYNSMAAISETSLSSQDRLELLQTFYNQIPKKYFEKNLVILIRSLNIPNLLPEFKEKVLLSLVTQLLNRQNNKDDLFIAAACINKLSLPKEIINERLLTFISNSIDRLLDAPNLFDYTEFFNSIPRAESVEESMIHESLIQKILEVFGSECKYLKREKYQITMIQIQNLSVAEKTKDQLSAKLSEIYIKQHSSDKKFDYLNLIRDIKKSPLPYKEKDEYLEGIFKKEISHGNLRLCESTSDLCETIQTITEVINPDNMKKEIICDFIKMFLEKNTMWSVDFGTCFYTLIETVKKTSNLQEVKEGITLSILQKIIDYSKLEFFGENLNFQEIINIINQAIISDEIKHQFTLEFFQIIQNLHLKKVNEITRSTISDNPKYQSEVESMKATEIVKKNNELLFCKNNWDFRQTLKTLITAPIPTDKRKQIIFGFIHSTIKFSCFTKNNADFYKTIQAINNSSIDDTQQKELIKLYSNKIIKEDMENGSILFRPKGTFFDFLKAIPTCFPDIENDQSQLSVVSQAIKKYIKREANQTGTLSRELVMYWIKKSEWNPKLKNFVLSHLSFRNKIHNLFSFHHKERGHRIKQDHPLKDIVNGL